MDRVFSRLTLQASPSDFCNKGFCEYVYEVEPCVIHWIKSSNSDTSPLKLLQPSNSSAKVQSLSELITI